MCDTVEIKYPDSVVEIWNLLHQSPSGSGKPFPDADRCGNVWFAIQKKLGKYFFNSKVPGIFHEDDAEEAASDYLVDFFQGVEPVHICSFENLAANARKYLARKFNPVGFEMNQILHEALRSLEKDGAVIRDHVSVGKRISGKSYFILAGHQSSNKISRFSDYERNRSDVPCYSSPLRNGDPGKTRMLSPSDAKDLVIRLLHAFGEDQWTGKGNLLAAMKNHIPEQLTEVPTSAGDDGAPSIDVADPNSDHSCRNDFRSRQLHAVALKTADRIWEQICKISQEVFCLYSLPKPEKKNVKLEQLGKPSTVSDQDKKIVRILCDELKNYNEMCKNDRQWTAVPEELRCVQQTAVRFLKRRCHDEGCDPLTEGKEQND